MTAQRKKVVAISGSTRINSTNESILRIIADLAGDRLEVSFFQGLAALPHFNPDLDRENVPPEVLSFREMIAQADGVVICTPEYVFSLPGALKNAIEWCVSTTVFSDKPVAFIVASGLGEKTFESLSLIMNTIGVKTGEHSRLLIQGVRAKVDRQGKITEEGTMQEIQQLVDSFIASIP